MIVPTKKFWALIAAGIPLALLGLAAPGAEWLLLPYNLALFLLLYFTWRTAKSWNFVTASRKVDPILSVRVPNVVKLIVGNESDQPLPIVIRDEPPVGSRATAHEFQAVLGTDYPREFTYTITPFERGADVFRETYVRFPAPLGLCEVQQKLDTEQFVRIYPNVLAVREFEMLKQRGRLDLMGVRRSRIKGLGQEFESLREYNEDDYRTIDWKASARRGRLVVRNFEQERNQGLIVCIDCGRHMLGEVKGVRKIDYALDSALMLMHAAERQGDQIGLLVFNDLVQRWISPKKGRSQVAAILDAIHGLEAEPVESDPNRAFSYLASRWKRRSLVVVFTDAEDEGQGKLLSTALSRMGRRHLVMVVRVSDPKLKQIRALEVQSERDLFLKTSGVMYQAERRRASLALASAGLQSVESEPDELSASLVSAYLRVKELNLL